MPAATIERLVVRSAYLSRRSRGGCRDEVRWAARLHELQEPWVACRQRRSERRRLAAECKVRGVEWAKIPVDLSQWPVLEHVGHEGVPAEVLDLQVTEQKQPERPQAGSGVRLAPGGRSDEQLIRAR